MLKEIFKDVIGYEGFYQVSNLGNIRSLDRVHTNKIGATKLTKGKTMSLCTKSNGYLTVMFSVNNIQKRFHVHRLVAKCFIENKERKPNVNHKNAIKYDNSFYNLEWVTQQENVNHALINGLIPCGEKSNLSKLTKNQVLSIRRLYKINPNFNKLALSRKLKVADSTIHKIINNQRWKHLI